MPPVDSKYYWGKFMSERDIEKTKWIEVSLGIACSADYLISVKKFMKEIAEELGWVVYMDKKGHISENGARVYNIDVKSKTKLTPEEIVEIRDRLIGFAYNLFDIIHQDSEEEMLHHDVPINLLTAKRPEEVEMRSDDGGVLIMQYKFKDRLDLERKNPTLARLVFASLFKEALGGGTIHKTGFLDKLFTDAETIEVREKYRQKLKDFFDIEIRVRHF